jgi:hypothetical protein
MSEEIKHDQRTFLCTAAMSIAAAVARQDRFCGAGNGCTGSISLLKFISRYSTTKKGPTSVGNFTQ